VNNTQKERTAKIQKIPAHKSYDSGSNNFIRKKTQFFADETA
jgi:hypothetical protein